MRGQRVFGVALAASLLAHLVVVGKAPNRRVAPPETEIRLPIQASLQLTTPQRYQPVEEPIPQARVRRGADSVDAPVSEPNRSDRQPERVQSEEPAQPVAEFGQPAAESSAHATAVLPDPNPPVQAQPDTEYHEPEAEEPIAAAESGSEASRPEASAPARALRNLPARIALHYRVESGESGFVIGRTRYNGEFEKGRYSLVSLTEATGVAAFFISGKIVQTSEGQVTEYGLQPMTFWSAKGQKSQEPLRFDWTQSRLMLPGGSVDLPPQTQDLMSFPFHLAMLMNDMAMEWPLSVTNGRKLRDYLFHKIGRVSLDLGERQVETLHLRGERSGEGSLDVWLAPAHHWLPVRIRTQDQKGKVIVLTWQGDPI